MYVHAFYMPVLIYHYCLSVHVTLTSLVSDNDMGIYPEYALPKQFPRIAASSIKFITSLSLQLLEDRQGVFT